MVEYTKIFKAEAKVGGPFELASLLQKRAVQLMRGEPALIETESTNWIQIATDEIIAGKITLVRGQPEALEELPEEAVASTEAGSGKKRSVAS
jgi:DNA-directed RNA polymerase subunit K/omega